MPIENKQLSELLERNQLYILKQCTRYAPQLRAMALDPEDLAQMVWEKVLDKGIGKARTIKAEQPLLAGVVRRIFIDLHRRHKGYKGVLHDVALLKRDTSQDVPRVNKEDIMGIIRGTEKLMSGPLADRNREIWKRMTDGQATASIARDMGLSVEVVKHQVSVLIRQVRHAYDKANRPPVHTQRPGKNRKYRKL